MEVLIRADANQNIGMGHIMRCLSLADVALSAGCMVEFLIADDSVSELIQSRGFKATVLDSDYTRMEEEKWPQNLQSDLIIVDSYYVTAGYLHQLREKLKPSCGKLIYIDDILSFPYPVDILVDYNAYSNKAIYDKLYEGAEQPHLILGPTFAPLRSMFRNLPKRIQKEKVENILISTGGADELHMSLKIIQAITSSVRTGYVYHFLIGPMNADKEFIREFAEKVDYIVIHEDVTDIKSLILSMDLAISAAGSTLYEISACGVPLITYSLADNQIPGGEAFENLGLAVNVGDLRNPKSINTALVMSGSLHNSAVDRIMKATDTLAYDYKRRCEMGKQMQEMIDGFGADRMVEEILRLT